MSDTSSNDLAFHYLYDSDVPAKPSKKPPKRLHLHCHHSSSEENDPSSDPLKSPPQACIEIATRRRRAHIEAKKSRLLERRQHAREVLERYNQLNDSAERLEILQNALAAAESNREYLLAKTAETCGKRVEEAKIRASKVKRDRGEEVRRRSGVMEERMREAERRRGEFLSRAGGRRMSNTSPHKGKSPKVKEVAAATIQRAFRRYRVLKAVKSWVAEDVTVDKVKNTSFEMCVHKFGDVKTVTTAKRLLNVMGLLGEDGEVKVFLSAYMILGHAGEIFQTSGDVEEGLIATARSFLADLESFVASVPVASKPPLALKMQYKAFLASFSVWKRQDARALANTLAKQYVQLDLMWMEIKDSSYDPVVEEDYHEGIRRNQLLLLTKIRKLVGDEVRVLIRRAVAKGRRERRSRLEEAMKNRPMIESFSEESKEQDEAVINSDVYHFEGTGTSNRQIVHELLLDSDYQIQPPPKSMLEEQITVTIKELFFDNVKASMLAGNGTDLVLGLVKDVKRKLLVLLVPETTNWRTLSDQMDLELIEQEVKRGIWDRMGWLEYVVNLMKQFCAPARDELVNSILQDDIQREDIGMWVECVRKALNVLDVMGLDNTNFHLRLAAPEVIRQGRAYLRQRFRDDLEGNIVSLDKTKKWLGETVDEAVREARTRDVDVQRKKSQPSTHGVFNQAFVGLIVCDDEKELPETMFFDGERMKNWRARARDIIMVAALLLVSKNFVDGRIRQGIRWTNLKDRLWILLVGNKDITPENVASEIEHFLTTSMSSRVIVLAMVKRILEGKDPFVRVLRRRMGEVIRIMIVGGRAGATINSGESQLLESFGLAEVSKEVYGLAGEIAKIGRLNMEIYGEWYNQIVRDGLLQSYNADVEE